MSFYFSAQYGISTASSLRELGFFVITRKKDGLVISDAIKNEQPDVAIIDGIMPGLDAIEAVLYPRETNYYYFCSDLETGEFFYAETLEEHEANLVAAHLK